MRSTRSRGRSPASAPRSSASWTARSRTASITSPRAEMLRHQGQKDCVDPLACTNTCTAMGQVITAVQACTDDLLTAIAKATGRPDKKKLVKRVDIASYPRPDADTGSADDLGGACMLGGTEPTKQPASCGLILCADAFAASGTNGSCRCGGVAGPFKPLDFCTSHRCPDGTLPDADCRCTEVGGYTPGRPPVPPIASINDLGTIQMLGTSTFATISADGQTTRMLLDPGSDVIPTSH